MKLTWSKSFILTASQTFNEIYYGLVNVGKFLILIVFIHGGSFWFYDTSKTHVFFFVVVHLDIRNEMEGKHI